MKNLFLALGVTLMLIPSAHATRETGGCGHPSSSYCAELGGKSFNVLNKTRGEIGVCRLIDDSYIEIHTLSTKNNLAMQAFLSLPSDIGNPASVGDDDIKLMAWEDARCREAGGRPTRMPQEYRPTLKWAMCEFADGSRIEERTLAYGPSSSYRLKEILNQPPGNQHCN